jgi:hypothetical protein
MVRAACRDPAIVTAVVVVGLGMPTLGSGLAILATLVVATKTQGTLLALAALLIAIGSLITLVGLVALGYNIRELAKERYESLALVTSSWSATYWPQAKQLAVDLVFQKSSQSDVRTVECWVDTGGWQGQLRPSVIDPHMTRKYRYNLRCTGEDIELPKSVVTIDLDVRMSLNDGVKKKAVAKVNLSHVG